MAVSSSGTDDSSTAHWRDTCARFFRDGDADSRTALEYFDLNCHRGEQKSDSNAPPAVSPAALKLLVEAGLVNSNGFAVAFTAERFDKYIAARNAARSAIHLEAMNARRDHFRAVLAGLLENGSSAPNSLPVDGTASLAAQLTTRRAAEEMRTRVNDFVRTYGQELCAHPFIKGFRELLQKQLGNAMIWRWVIQEEMFFEAAGNQFMIDSLTLLVCFFRFVPREELAEMGSSSVAWEVSQDLSDVRIGRLLTLLPKSSRLEGCATGEFVLTSLQRNNISGSNDEPDGLPVLIREWCVLL